MADITSSSVSGSGTGSSSANIFMNFDEQILQATDLGDIVVEMANMIYAIDNQIYELAEKGIEGEAIMKAADSYLQIREQISIKIRDFADKAVIAHDNIENAKKYDEAAATAAAGSN